MKTSGGFENRGTARETFPLKDKPMKQERTFVIVDIHGAYEALMQCLSRADFSYESDRLICLGDVSDRRPGVKQCLSELLKIRHLVYILGNHDLWTLEWMKGKKEPGIWTSQGGRFTMDSYSDGIPGDHIHLLENAQFYHVEGNDLFVHGGMDQSLPLEKQQKEDLAWDRSLVFYAYEIDDDSISLGGYHEIYVGHTPTLHFETRAHRAMHEKYAGKEPGVSPTKNVAARKDYPMKFCNVWLMDTGAGWPGGRLSMMNLETRAITQSDPLN